jgi:hypothetical protein
MATVPEGEGHEGISFGIGERFSSYDDLEEKIKLYEQQTYTQ